MVRTFSEEFDGVFCKKFLKNLQMMEVPKANIYWERD